MDNENCDHKFVYGGVKYEIKEWKLAGSGAQPVYYFDWFYCEKCLKEKFQQLKEETDTYGKILYGATPKREGS